MAARNLLDHDRRGAHHRRRDDQCVVRYFIQAEESDRPVLLDRLDRHQFADIWVAPSSGAQKRRTDCNILDFFFSDQSHLMLPLWLDRATTAGAPCKNLLKMNWNTHAARNASNPEAPVKVNRPKPFGAGVVIKATRAAITHTVALPQLTGTLSARFSKLYFFLFIR